MTYAFSAVRRAVLTLVLACCAAMPAMAQDRLDTRRMSEGDARFLQGALVMAGTYEGLLDGKWGPGSDRALRQAIGGNTAQTDGIRRLVDTFRDELERGGWDWYSDPRAELSYLLPFALLSAPEGRWPEGRLQSTGPLLRIDRIVERESDIRDRHVRTFRRHERGDEPYTLRQEDQRWITTAEERGGLRWYVYSVPAGDRWVTLQIRAERPHWQRLALIAGSIRRAAPGADLAVERDGTLDPFLPPALPRLAETPRIIDAPRPKGRNDGRGDFRRLLSGSGFYVNGTDIVTANHVVQDCERPQLRDGAALRVVTRDVSLGVTVLTSEPRSPVWLSLDRAPDLRRGDPVLTAGFDRGERQMRLKTFEGTVAAPPEARAGRNARLVFVSKMAEAMSGGPLLDGDGRVLGVVVSRPQVMAALSRDGALPVDTGLAVPSLTLLSFLRDNGVANEWRRDGGSLRERSAEIRDAVVPILCD